MLFLGFCCYLFQFVVEERDFGMIFDLDVVYIIFFYILLVIIGYTVIFSYKREWEIWFNRVFGYKFCIMEGENKLE